MARAALRDDLHAVHAQLTAQVLLTTVADDPAPARIAAWEEDDAVLVARAAETLEEICADEDADLARMSVGLRVVRGLLAWLRNPAPRETTPRVGRGICEGGRTDSSGRTRHRWRRTRLRPVLPRDLAEAVPHGVRRRR